MYKEKTHMKTLDHEAVRELELYINNNGELYRRMKLPIETNLARKWAKGTYRADLAVKAFIRLAIEGAKAYNREFSSTDSRWNELFPVAERLEVARRLEKSFRAEAELGNF